MLNISYTVERISKVIHDLEEQQVSMRLREE